MLPQRKHAPRLDITNYLGARSYFITCATYKRANHFTNNENVNFIKPILRDVGKKQGFTIYAYCFMPDHLHILTEGEERADLKTFVKIFKQASGYAFKKRTGDPLWQRGYYEHVNRRKETLKDVAHYILNNPVRARLVEDYRDYPHSGSFVFDIKDM